LSLNDNFSNGISNTLAPPTLERDMKSNQDSPLKAAISNREKVSPNIDGNNVDSNTAINVNDKKIKHD